MNQIVKKIPTELQYIERSVFMKQVSNQKEWLFELGVGESMNIPICVIIRFQQQDRKDSQNLNNETFCKLPVVSAKCVISTENYPNAGILLNYNDDDYNQGYGEIQQAFKSLVKDDILQPYISDHDFRSSNDGNNIGYNLYIFDVRYQKNLEAAQSIKVEFRFSENIPENTINGYALVLKNKLISISSDGQRDFDLISVIFKFFIKILFSFNVKSVFFSNASLYLFGKLSNL